MQMAGSPSHSDGVNDAGPGPNPSSPTIYPGTPRWVKAFGIIALALVLLVAVLLVASGGGHGPGRHIPSGSPAGSTAPLAHGVQQTWTRP